MVTLPITTQFANTCIKVIHPHFLTDTEAAALLFDLFIRSYGYPLEYVIEMLAPTTERDFTLLPEAKQKIYQILQKTHMHVSPDGPWFFLIAQSLSGKAHRLIGITDTSMLRPQVFALQQGEVPIGFAASEKQAIDSVLRSLALEDNRFWQQADHYWNARGGSYTNRILFFTVQPEAEGEARFICQDKFGLPVVIHAKNEPYTPKKSVSAQKFPDLPTEELLSWVKKNISSWSYDQMEGFLVALRENAVTDQNCRRAIEVLSKLIDERQYPEGKMRYSSLCALLNQHLADLLQGMASLELFSYCYLSFDKRKICFDPELKTLLIDASEFPSEGEDGLAREIVKRYKGGFKKFIVFNCRGQRFVGNGLGPKFPSSFDRCLRLFWGLSLFGYRWCRNQDLHRAARGAFHGMKKSTLIVHGDVADAVCSGAKAAADSAAAQRDGRSSMLWEALTS